MKKIIKKPSTARIRPMLASLSSEPFDSPDYIYEARWEGVRCIAFVDGGAVRLQSRRLIDISDKFPELQRLPQQLVATSAVLDGVIVVPKDGRPQASKAHQRQKESDPAATARHAAATPALMIAFDLLYLDGQDLRGRPLLERKELLKAAVNTGPAVVVGTWVEERGKALLAQLARLGMEGVIAKSTGSTYQSGTRSLDWLKMQRFKLQDCLICGYTEGQGRRADWFGALVLGVCHEGKLTHIGQVGSGYNRQTMEEIHALIHSRSTPDCPFPVQPHIERPVTWVTPDLVCAVQYSEWTAGLKLRAPRFVHLHHDKAWRECSIEEVCRGPELQLDPLALRLPE